MSSQSGPVCTEAYEAPPPDGGQSGPVCTELFDSMAVGQSGPVCTELFDAMASGQSGPVVPFDLYAEPTVAFSAPARALATGRAYTQGQQSTQRQLEETPTLDLTVLGGSYQLASLPVASGDVLFTQIILQCTAGVGITVDAVVSITDQDGNTIVPATTLTNFRLPGDVFVLNVLGSARLLQQNVDGAVLVMSVVTPASTGTLVATGRAIGFPA